MISKHAIKQSIAAILPIFTLILLALSLLYLIANITTAAQTLLEVLAARFLEEPEAWNFIKVSLGNFHIIIDTICPDKSAATGYIIFRYCWSLYLSTRTVMTSQAPAAFQIQDIEYASRWIQYGLLGTLWGFVIIGIQMDAEINRSEGTALMNFLKNSLSLLLKGYGTAIISTLTGVLFVYVIIPMTHKAWNFLWDIEDQENRGDIDPDVEMEKLGRNLHAMNGNLQSLVTHLDGIEKRMQAMEPREVLRFMLGIARLLHTLADITRENRERDREEINEHLEALGTRLGGLEEQLNQNHDTQVGKIRKLADTLTKAMEIFEDLPNALHQIKPDISELQREFLEKNSSSMDARFQTQEDNFKITLQSIQSEFKKHVDVRHGERNTFETRLERELEKIKNILDTLNESGTQSKSNASQKHGSPKATKGWPRKIWERATSILK